MCPRSRLAGLLRARTHNPETPGCHAGGSSRRCRRAQVVEPAGQARIALSARPHFPNFTQKCTFVLNGAPYIREALRTASGAPLKNG